MVNRTISNERRQYVNKSGINIKALTMNKKNLIKFYLNCEAVRFNASFTIFYIVSV